ncbi:hypothetical protein ACN38_g12461 [Penicillium nordicum]|uniref:Uncharacterized protein n=1 Tax=Penicillium nordicum TaxID=229535 RepID=A0A0M8NPK5_9EURO|nr:hypothetical protein ACN38_g12461 [Penicillium nordicum]
MDAIGDWITAWTCICVPPNIVPPHTYPSYTPKFRDLNSVVDNAVYARKCDPVLNGLLHKPPLLIQLFGAPLSSPSASIQGPLRHPSHYL